METIEMLLQYVLAAIVVLLSSLGIGMISLTLHEGSHWIVARRWSSEIEITRLSLIFPVSMRFHSPYDFPPHGVRLVGAAPLLFWLPVAVAIYVALYASPLGRFLFSLPFWWAAIPSPSDVLAVLYPRRFQEYAASGDTVGHIGTIKILLQEVSSSLFNDDKDSEISAES